MTDLHLEGVLPEYYPNGVSGEHFKHILKALDAGGYKPGYLREVVAAVQWKAKQEGFKKHWGKAITVGVRELLGQITRRKGLAAENPSGALPRTVVTKTCEEYEPHFGTMKSRKCTTQAVQFETMSRSGELARIQRKDIKVIPASDGAPLKCGLMFRRGKGDRQGKGRDVMIEDNGRPDSAARWLVGLLGAKAWKDEERVFTSRPAMTMFMKARAIAYHPSELKITSHSGRRGGAHFAALAGVPDCAIKVQGGWNSPCYQKYTDLSVGEAAHLIATRMAE
jgi:hypothetical protein